MSVPEQAGGQALVVEAQAQALKQGETADFLQLTRAVSGVVNGGGAWVLGLVKLVVSFPPTKVDATSAVWGPWPDRDDPVTWKMTVTKVGEHKYEYKLEGRDKTLADGPFTVVLSGVHTAAVDAAGLPIEGFGSGNFLLDWDARNTLPARPRHPLNNQPDVGKAAYSYARAERRPPTCRSTPSSARCRTTITPASGSTPTTSTGRPRAPAAAWSSCTPPPRT